MPAIYFLAWNNSVRRDLEALGVLESSGSLIDALLRSRPADMTNEQLEIALALCKRQLALWDRSDARRSSEIKPVAIEAPVSG